MEKSIYSADYQRLCGLLRELREQAGLTQAEVAALLKEPQSFVSKYESGERRLDVVELRLVAEALSASIGKVVARLWPDAAADFRWTDQDVVAVEFGKHGSAGGVADEAPRHPGAGRDQRGRRDP